MKNQTQVSKQQASTKAVRMTQCHWLQQRYQPIYDLLLIFSTSYKKTLKSSHSTTSLLVFTSLLVGLTAAST